MRALDAGAERRMKALWGEQQKTISTCADLDLVIGAVLASGKPTMVFLEGDNGRVLVFGVGREESVLTFVESDGTTFHSLGDANRKERIVFFCRDQPDEFMGEMAVPSDA